MSKKLRVAITHGDINGVGYELIFKTFADQEMLDLCIPIVYGTPKVAAYHRNALDVPAVFSIIATAGEAREGRLNLLTTIEEDVKISFGQPTEESSAATKKALDRALKDLSEGQADVLVLGPAGLIDGIPQEKYIEQQLKQEGKSMALLLGDSMKIGFATHLLPLQQVAESLTPELVEQRIRLFQTALKRDLRINNPRIAVLSAAATPPQVNGESHPLTAMIEKLRDESIYAFGPMSAEELFADSSYAAYDGILAMYDEQGLIPFISLNAQKGIYVQTGLPIVCTTPQQINIYQGAGKGQADVLPFRQAIFAAVDIYRNRLNYDEPMAHPLPKLYHERRDESEKVRFNVPKKQDMAERKTDAVNKQKEAE